MNLLFDLDGTLTDPAVGITRCIQHAMAQLERPCPPTADLLRFIGPPLREAFAELLATTDQALVSRAVARFRERFATVGMLENEVYPDVPATLTQLADAGHHLWIVTSKPTVYARSILDHFELSERFREIYGSELDGRNADKGELIRIVLATEQLAPHETWMIGDRLHDIRGGRLNGLRTAGVLWGYGTEEELRAAEADELVSSIAELASLYFVNTTCSA